MKHHNQLRSGSLLTYVQMTLNIIVSIAYTPFMLRILGKSEYGLYSTVASTIAILSVLSLGFGGSYVRYYILYRKEKADDKIARLNGLFLIVFSVIGLIALACGLYLTFHLEMVFKTGLTDAEYHTARILMLLLTANLAVSSVTELYPNIFDWLKAHDVNAAVIIGIMLVVAFFNMTSALLILVLERTRMIGLLKAFGMRNATLREVFLWRAAFVTLRGLAWGNAAGLAVCLVQKYFHVVKLSSEGYLLSEVPVALGWGWWLALNAGVVAAIVALLVVPACIVSTVKPDESIRYE